MASHTVPGQGLELKMNDIRRQADSVLGHLLAEQAACERRLAETERADPIRTVTGRSALDDAIVSTRQMIREIDRYLTCTTETPAAPVHRNGFATSSVREPALP